MCGRYTIYTKREALEERFHASMPESAEYAPSYNAAPSQNMPVILGSDPETITLANWGFIPHWVQDPMSARVMINARAETISEKLYFRDSFKRRRCLVLTDGFYEWDRTGEKKVPYYISLARGGPFSFAGIWDTVRETDGKEYPTYAIITTRSNELVGAIHDRMPVILHPEDEADWLDESLRTDDAASMLRSYEPELLEMHAVSPQVNRVSFNAPEAIEPVRT